MLLDLMSDFLYPEPVRHNESLTAYCTSLSQDRLFSLRCSTFISPIMTNGDSMQCCYREQVAYAIYARFRLPKLYQYAGNMARWEHIPARCASHPQEMLFVNKYPPHDTALHQVVRQNLDCVTKDVKEQLDEWKAKAIESLLSKKTASQVDGLGRLPLHVACMTMDEDSIRRLVNEYPEGCLVQDRVDKRTPLHYLLARWEGELPLKIIHAMIHDTQILQIQDLTKERPFDVVVRRLEPIGNRKEAIDVLEP